MTCLPGLRAPSRACAPALVAALCACGHGSNTFDMRALTSKEVIARVLADAAGRDRLTGTVRARIPGVAGVVASADLDVAVQAPAALSVAVRSFFDQPSQVLVTDGTTFTLFDTSDGNPVFYQGAPSAAAMERLLALPVSPNEAVQIFLQRPPPGARARLLDRGDALGVFHVWLEAIGQGPVELGVRAADGAILSWRVHARDGSPLLDVSYGDFVVVGAARFARHFTITMLGGQNAGKALAFDAVDVVYNGTALPADAFVLVPTPGVTVRSLP